MSAMVLMHDEEICPIAVQISAPAPPDFCCRRTYYSSDLTSQFGFRGELNPGPVQGGGKWRGRYVRDGEPNSRSAIPIQSVCNSEQAPTSAANDNSNVVRLAKTLTPKDLATVAHIARYIVDSIAKPAPPCRILQDEHVYVNFKSMIAYGAERSTEKDKLSPELLDLSRVDEVQCSK
ncbi:hypothetical protein FIBSPDRAFT_886724 [Athelia psychrophila]|uniref:Uncharacterized protein n=1 Tax=Athelia psychrophila TaxID=1759441 RepID=A0A166QG47_9AGAM|nr:hypothetical protein FIBSPDRAFT_886724 [Fibularhizoctonia sp. CBS 109695]